MSGCRGKSGWSRRAAATATVVGGLALALPAGPASAAVVRVTMADMRFNPARLRVAAGDAVVWRAGDGDHTVTARDGTFDSTPGGPMGEGDDFRYRFRSPGTFPYFCRIHQARGMQGEIEVVDPYTDGDIELGPIAATTTSTTTAATPKATSNSTTTTTTTSTTAPPSSTTTATTARVLATSSTTGPAAAVSPSTTLAGTPVAPRESPTLNPAAPVLGSGPARVPDATPAAVARTAGRGGGASPAVGLGLLGAVGLTGAGAFVLARRRAARRPGPG